MVLCGQDTPNILILTLDVIPYKFRHQIDMQKCWDIKLLFSENCMITASAALSQYTRVTERQTILWHKLNLAVEHSVKNQDFLLQYLKQHITPLIQANIHLSIYLNRHSLPGVLMSSKTSNAAVPRATCHTCVVGRKSNLIKETYYTDMRLTIMTGFIHQLLSIAIMLSSLTVNSSRLILLLLWKDVMYVAVCKVM